MMYTNPQLYWLNRLRRHELGKMLLDVAKYVLTIVVIGGLVAERLNFRMLGLGIVMAIVFIVSGFWTLPLERKDND